MNNLHHIIQNVKAAIDIFDVVAEHVNLDQACQCRCPFHNDRDPSMHVYRDSQLFHCFGCGAHGDVIDFVQRICNCSLPDALKILCEKAGIPFAGLSDAEIAEHGRAMDKYVTLTGVATHYNERLTPAAKDWLHNRGISDATIERYKIGYADGTLSAKMGAPDIEILADAGIVKIYNDGSAHDHFCSRIIIPNIVAGKVVHMTGRTIGDANPKYLHLSGGIEHWYNEDGVRSEVVVLTEGVFDALALLQAGFNAMGLYGTNGFGLEDVERLSRCKTVYLCMDGDDAGRKAAVRIAGMLPDKARVVVLPDGVDPDEFILKNGADAFRALMASAPNAVTYLVGQIPAETDHAELSALLEPVLRLLAQMSGPVAETHLDRTIRQRFGLTAVEVKEYRAMLKTMRDEAKVVADDGVKQQTTLIALAPWLIDVVEQDGKTAFLVTGADGKPQIVSQYVNDGETYAPPSMGKIPFMLPRGVEVLRHATAAGANTAGADRGLLDGIIAFLKTSIAELPSERHYLFLALWLLHSYLLEHTHYSPFIILFAVPERGKSRLGKGLIYMCWRGLHVECLNEAYILRIGQNLGSTLFIDVVDLMAKLDSKGSEDVLQARFERGVSVPRVNNPDRGPFEDIDYYSIFGPTIIGTNVAPGPILETRGIVINMPKTARRFEDDVLPQTCLPYKEQLVAFRARHLNTTLPACAKIADGRLGDILRPLHQVLLLVAPDMESEFLAFAKDVAAERKVVKAETLEARIIRAVRGAQVTCPDALLYVQDIARELNAGKPPKECVGNPKIGKTLRTAIVTNKSATNTGRVTV